MKKIFKLAVIVIGLYQMSGCSALAIVAYANRTEGARVANAGKQLIPKDGATYLIPVSLETFSYLGSANTDWKVNNTTFTQPKGTYSVVKVEPGIYDVFGNRLVVGGGEAGLAMEIKASEAICFFVFNPLSGSARVESYKGDSCVPILRSLWNHNVVEKIN